MSTWRALASSNKNTVEQLSDDDWETDANFENDITEQEQRWGSKTVKNSGRLADNINFKQVIEDIQIEDKKVKEQFIHDSCNASSGFGGKFGVQKERVDRSAVNYDYHPELNKHESQKDYSKGFGGKFGVQKDRVDKSAVDWNYHEKVDKHESQKDYSKGFGGKFGVQKDRVDKSAVDWNYHEKVDKHTSQINATKPASVNKIKVPEFKDEHPGQENKSNNELNRSIGKVKVPNFQTDEQENKSNNESNRSIGKVKVPNFQTDEQQQPKPIDSNKPISTGKLKLPTQFTNSNETDKTSIKQTNEPVNRGNANALKSKFENLIKDSDSENQRKIEEERLRRLQKEKDEKNKAKQEEEERQKKLKIEAEQRKLTEQENEIEQNDESDDEQVISSSSKVNKIGVSVLPSTQLTKQNSRTSNRSSSFDSENEFNDNEQQINESEKSGNKILNEIVNVNENQVVINEKESINEKKKEEEELKRLKELELQRELEEEELRKKLAEEADESLIEDEVNDVKEIKAVALYDYEAQEGDEISFLPGDVITNIEKVDSGWWRGQVDGGKVGLFPSNYVEELS